MEHNSHTHKDKGHCYPQRSHCHGDFSLTRKAPPDLNAEWKAAKPEEVNLDVRLVALIQLLARRAAWRDYELLLMTMQSKDKASDEKGTQ